MNGRWVILIMLVTGIVIGGGLYYAQVYAYYHRVSLGPGLQMTLVPRGGGKPQVLSVTDFHGVDAPSSPIRLRACFRLAQPLAELEARYQPYRGATPLIAPAWFSCFDARAIGTALKAGRARAFLARAGIAPEVDRVIAVFPDGRAYAWQQLNPAAPKSNSPIE